jgi:aspartyl-tRNA(Asn)/glutamyl-tRNA(Gln) amidotransferase subunit A
MIDLKNLTIKKARILLDKKEISVKDLVDAYLKNISEKNSDLNIYREVYSDLENQIDSAQKIIDSGKSADLTGIPFSIKDNILFKGKIAGASSKILENYKATYNSTVVEKMLEQNAVILGRTNMDEFAMGGSTENSAYGATKNPIDPERVPGGSSGGSAASVSGEMALASLGSDTGGSIRQPASFCGVVGLKPTYGSVSRHGLIAMASSLDVIGPITKNVEDAEIVFNVIKGKDKYDSTSIEGSCDRQVKKIGVPRNYLKGLDQDVLDNFENSLKRLQDQGYEIQDVLLPNLDYSLAVYYVLMPAEVSSNMARFDGIKYGSKIDGDKLLDVYLKTRGQLIGKEVKSRIILGTYVLSAGYADDYYKKAWKVRNLIKNEIREIFEKVDLLALPTSPVPAFKIGEKANDPIQMYLADIFTVFVNLAGVPAISIPDGFVKRENSELPTGLELIAPHLCEQALFQVGKKFERI